MLVSQNPGCRNISFTSQSQFNHPCCENPNDCGEFVRQKVYKIQTGINAPIPPELEHLITPDDRPPVDLKGITTADEFIEQATDPAKPPEDRIRALVEYFLSNRHFEAKATMLAPGEVECAFARDMATTDIFQLTDDAKRNAAKYAAVPSLVLGRMINTSPAELAEYLLGCLARHARS